MSSGSVPIPDGGSAFQSASVPGFSGVYVKGMIVTVQIQHQNWGDLALSLTSPGGLQWNLKQANNTGGGSAGGAVDGSFQFFNLDCLEAGSLPPASQGGPGPFAMSGASIWTTPGSALGGQWTLQASDAKTGETGTIRGFQVQIVGQQAVCGVQMVVTSQPPIFTAPVNKVSVEFLVTAPNIQGTTTINIVSLQGGLGATCVNTVGATFNGPAPFGIPVTVVCDLGSRTLGQGLYTLNVQAVYTDANSCSTSGSQLASGTVFVQADPNGGNNTVTPPTVTLSSAADQRICSQAPGSEYVVTADFPFTVQTSNGQQNGLAWDVGGSASSPEFRCTALRTCE
eukprot:gene3896-4150_t